MKVFLLTFLCFIASAGGLSFGQTPSKLNLSLQKKAADRQKATRPVALFVKGDVHLLKKEVLKSGGRLKYCYNNICAVEIPANRLWDFSSSPAILNIEDGEIPMQLLMDTALIHNNVVPIHNGQSPLISAYTGAGVIIGIIDDGIDINHPDFKNANGTTRIRYIWDQYVLNPQNPPVPYNYGEQWNYNEINAGACNHTERGLPNTSHGTNVTGVATGNGLATGFYKGVAPDADIIVVSIDKTTAFLARMIDAVDYIFKKADAMGKPCVINVSQGIYNGSHDGSDLAAQLIDAMLEERNGRVLVAAAGNAGNIKFHLGYDVQATPKFTWFKYNASVLATYFEIWTDTADFNNVDFSFGADNPNGWVNFGQIDFLNIKEDYNLSQGNGFNLNRTLVDGTTFIGSINTFAELQGGLYKLEVYIQPSNPSYYWRFITKGNGRFDCWNHPVLIPDFAEIVTTNLPTVAQVPDIGDYMMPDLEKTIVSSFTCSEKVITVANFYNRHHYTDVDSNVVILNEQPGAIASNSSHGPTRDGRIKPDVGATGSTTMICGNSILINTFLGNLNRLKVGPGGMHFRNGGTSLAAPIVAGTAALYLEKNPNANWQELKVAITQTARTDSFTGSDLPDNTWGFGKIDAFAAMFASITYGCMDSTALNYNPSANVDDGSCIPLILGCTDSTALNFNPMATVDDGSCVYDTIDGIGIVPNDFTLSIIPNPSDGEFSLVLNKSPFSMISVSVVNIYGRKVDELKWVPGKQITQYSNELLSSGIYFVEVTIGNTILVEKMIVQ